MILENSNTNSGVKVRVKLRVETQWSHHHTSSELRGGLPRPVPHDGEVGVVQDDGDVGAVGAGDRLQEGIDVREGERGAEDRGPMERRRDPSSWLEERLWWQNLQFKK